MWIPCTIAPFNFFMENLQSRRALEIFFETTGTPPVVLFADILPTQEKSAAFKNMRLGKPRINFISSTKDVSLSRNRNTSSILLSFIKIEKTDSPGNEWVHNIFRRVRSYQLNRFSKNAVGTKGFPVFFSDSTISLLCF